MAFPEVWALGITDTLSYFIEHAKEIERKITLPISMVSPYLAVIATALSLLSATLVAECLSQFVKIDRPKAYIATAVASTLNLLPIIVFGAFRLTLVFAYLREGSANSP